MKPTIVSFFWGELSRLEWVCLNSFVKFGFDVHLYTCAQMRVPSGVELKDAGAYIDCCDIKFYGRGAGSGKGSPSLTSNIFRYRILSDSKSTCWVDTDMLCLSEFSIDGNYLYGIERDRIVNSAILGVGENGDIKGLFKCLSDYVADPFKLYYSDHPKVFLKKLLARLKGRTSWEDVPWGVTGPLAVTSMLNRLKMRGLAEPARSFYPIPFKHASLLFEPMGDDEYEAIFSEAKACHLWNEVLRHQGINKNVIFDANSPYERIICKLRLDEGWYEP